MDADATIDRRQSALDLVYAEHLLIWALRRLVVLRGAICPAVAHEFAGACGGAAGEVIATFRAFVGVLGHTARRPISVGHPGWPGLTGDERQLLSLIAASQEDDSPKLDTLLCWFARSDVRHELALAVQAIAAAFAAHDLRFPVAPRPSRAPAVSPRLRLIS